MEIRIISETEILDVLKLIAKLFPKAYPVLKENDQIYVAIEGEKIIGFLHMTEKEDKILLNGIGIVEEYRGKHVGTKLMGHLIDEAKDRPIYLKVTEKNFIAQALYEKFGFVPKRYGRRYVLVKSPEN
ncbi:MAG: GNAT family N-acetyltransferase [Candidatus Micrarchaeota archaeon]